MSRTLPSSTHVFFQSLNGLATKSALVALNTEALVKHRHGVQNAPSTDGECSKTTSTYLHRPKSPAALRSVLGRKVLSVASNLFPEF